MMPLDVETIEELIPHRFPFLLVDRVLELDLQHVVAIKNVTANEAHFQGHFPGQKVMPGVLIIEALAQSAAIMSLALPERHGWIAFLAGVDNAKFRRQVVPGDTLTLRAELVKMKGSFGVVNAKASVGEEVAVTCEIKFAFQKPRAKGID